MWRSLTSQQCVTLQGLLRTCINASSRSTALPMMASSRLPSLCSTSCSSSDDAWLACACSNHKCHQHNRGCGMVSSTALQQKQHPLLPRQKAFPHAHTHGEHQKVQGLPPQGSLSQGLNGAGVQHVEMHCCLSWRHGVDPRQNRWSYGALSVSPPKSLPVSTQRITR